MLIATEIAARLGLKRYRRSWRGQCPVCNYAGNAFSLREFRKGFGIYCANGCDRDQLASALNGIGDDLWCRLAQPSDVDVAARRARRQAAGLALWNGSERPLGTLVQDYGVARSLPALAMSAAVRFRLDTPHPEGGCLPAMIALVQDATGAPIGIHRTYLRRDGQGKADIEPSKASLGPVWGGAVQLDPVGAELVIGEGIETSASAGVLLGLPAWAAITAGNLASGLVLPPEVRSVVIAADPDNAGRKAARAAWQRWTAEGRRVRIATPNQPNQDFNDLLREANHE